jgi:hypothetical protein
MQKVYLGYALKFGRSFTQALEITVSLWTAKNHTIEPADSLDNPNFFYFVSILKIEKEQKKN